MARGERGNEREREGEKEGERREREREGKEKIYTIHPQPLTPYMFWDGYVAF